MSISCHQPSQETETRPLVFHHSQCSKKQGGWFSYIMSLHDRWAAHILCKNVTGVTYIVGGWNWKVMQISCNLGGQTGTQIKCTVPHSRGNRSPILTSNWQAMGGKGRASNIWSISRWLIFSLLWFLCILKKWDWRHCNFCSFLYKTDWRDYDKFLKIHNNQRIVTVS